MAFDPIKLGLKPVETTNSQAPVSGFQGKLSTLKLIKPAQAPAAAQNRFMPGVEDTSPERVAHARNLSDTPDVSSIPIIGPDIATALKRGKDILSTPQKGLIGKIQQGIDLAGAVTSPISDAPIRLAESADQFLTGGAIKSAVKGAVTDVAQSWPGRAVVGAVSDLAQKHPTLAKNFGNVMSIAGAIPAAGAIEKIGAESADIAGNAAAKTTDIAGGLIKKGQLAATKGNSVPTLETAARRIQKDPVLGIRVGPMRQGIGGTSLPSPSNLHAQYFAQEQKALADAKQDTALGMVGSDIGDSFGRVVAQRKTAGKIMGDELEKSATKPVAVGPVFGNLQKELLNNGATYDSITGELFGGPTSKFSTADKNILGKYATDLQTLGPNPTMKELDAFISRTPNEIKELKASKGIVSKTNAERIIKSNLDDLRDSLGSAGSKTYNTARGTYSKLSKFIQEGEPYLGKITQSGDYAKDASLAKSSVQSVLNNGKKDWLLQLEKLTGDPLLDKATLALQAMKDAGDYRGASLLESLTEGATKGSVPEIPTTMTSMVNTAGGALLKKGARKFVGTPYEQTQRYLKSIEGR